ncbi:MAG: archaeosortase/exosortase family protein, partial [Thermoflexibacteraceae bacterium]
MHLVIDLMSSSFSVSVPPIKPLLLYVGVLFVLGIYNYFLPHVIWDINTFGGLLLLPYLFIFHPQEQKTAPSWRFGVLSALFLCLAVALPRQNSPLFFALCFALFFLVENILGKLALFSLWTIGLVSPLLRYFGTSFSFPIRLELTNIAGKALGYLFTDVSNLGNVITLNGQEFSVDPACVGLKMIGTSLMIALLFMAYFQRLTQKIIPFWLSCVLILCVMLLNIINNLLRIMILVVFRVMPETPLHDILGLLSLLIYVIIPFYFIAKY